MKLNLNKIEDLLKSKKLKQFKLDPKVDKKLLKTFENMRIEREFAETVQRPSLITYLTHLIMNSFKRYAAVTVALVLVVSGVFYYNQTTTYSYHLNKAKVALAELEAVISGSPQFSFIPAALAQDGNVDEQLVSDLTIEVVDETEAAIEAAEDLSDPQAVETALEEISEVQEETIEVFAEAVEVVESAEATQVVADALETTVEEQTLVENATEFVESAIEAGEETVSIDIETSEDKPSEEKRTVIDEAAAQALVEETRALLDELIASGIPEEDVEKVASKLEKIEEAIEEGKYGRAHGLSIAAEAQSKHLTKRQEKAEEALEEAEEERQDVLEEAAEEGVELPEDAFAEYDDLLSQSQAAFEAGNFRGAEKLAEEAEELLDDVEDIIDELEDEKEMREDAEETIQEVKDRRAEIEAEAEKEGIELLPEDAFAEYDDLLAQSQAAFEAGNFRGAEKLAEEAEELLDDVEDIIEELEEAKEEKENAQEGLEKAQSKIQEAIDRIEEMENKGSDTSRAVETLEGAKSTLAEAQAAFEAGEYGKAETLAKEARKAADKAKDLEDEDSDEEEVTTPTAPEEVTTPTATEERR